MTGLQAALLCVTSSVSRIDAATKSTDDTRIATLLATTRYTLVSASRSSSGKGTSRVKIAMTVFSNVRGNFNNSNSSSSSSRPTTRAQIFKRQKLLCGQLSDTVRGSSGHSLQDFRQLLQRVRMKFGISCCSFEVHGIAPPSRPAYNNICPRRLHDMTLNLHIPFACRAT